MIRFIVRRHKRAACVLLAAVLLFLISCGTTEPSAPPEESVPVVPAPFVPLTEEEIRDKVEGSWAAQMIGVAWGAPTEFRYCGALIPEDAVPAWEPTMINEAFGQDDLYVEIPFLDVFASKGPDCALSDLADAFRDTAFPLDHANRQGRQNLRDGIPAPDSGSYQYNYHCDDIDWQIEADFLGNLYPGLVGRAANRAFEIGHIMNYGDGVYGGVYIAAMHAAAFTAKSVREIADIGRTVIPKNTKFRSVLDEVDGCYAQGMTWQECWERIQTDWAGTARCLRYLGSAANIDAKLNAAYIHIGLLWGNGDLAETIKISMRCGQDSDCNPSSAAGVLGAFYGLKGIPAEYVSALDRTGTLFSNTSYSFDDCVGVSMNVVKKVLAENGVAQTDGYWLLPELSAVPEEEKGLVPVEQWPSDEPTAYLSASVVSGGKVRLDIAYALPEGYEGEVLHSLDLGDGRVLPFVTGSYDYRSDGTYEIVYTLKTGEKESVARATVTVSGAGDRGFLMEPSCSTEQPAGGGSRDIRILTDGRCPDPYGGSAGEQYDTYTGSASESEWFALTFNHSVNALGIRYTEGMHFDNGGWFVSTPDVQILVNGVWKDAASSCSPAYPGDSAPAETQFATFVFTLDAPVWCEGIRVSGRPGGSATFASCSELDVLFDDVRDPTYEPAAPADPVRDAVIIASVTDPKGTGCRDLEIIRDGHVPKNGEDYQKVSYDTFAYSSVDHEEYVGYVFAQEQRVSGVVFTEGANFNDGGFFKDGSIRLELLQDGVWVRADASPDPPYPVGDTPSAFGANYDSYTFRLSAPAVCGGIRIAGSAGGTAHFISVSELAVEFAGETDP